MSVLKWFEQWFFSHCDRDWEQENLVVINSLGNPGWSIEIDLLETALEGVEIPYTRHDKNEPYPSLQHDWWAFKITNNKFEGSGDVGKLEFLLEKFRSLVEEAEQQAKASGTVRHHGCDPETSD